MKPLKKTVSKCVFFVGTLLLLFFLFGGVVLDDLHLAPFFGFRTEWAKPAVRQVNVEVQRYQCDTVKYEIQEGGAGGIGVMVSLIREDKKILEVGGDESTFVGFRDVDGDGTNEVLVTSLGRWPDKGVWKANSTGFVKAGENFKASLILRLATWLMYAKLGVLLSTLLIAWGVIGIRDSRKLRNPSGPYDGSTT